MNKFVMKTPFGGRVWKEEFTALPLSKMEIDTSYQRDEIKGHINQIVEGFNPHAMKPIFVSRRNGTYLIRLVELGQLPAGYQAKVRIVRGLTQSEEKELYLLTQKSRKNTKGEVFKAREDTWKSGVIDALQTLGWTYNLKSGSQSRLRPHRPANMIHRWRSGN